MLTTEKVEFGAKETTGEREKEGHCTVIKGPICQDDIRARNMHAPNSSTSKNIN